MKRALICLVLLLIVSLEVFIGYEFNRINEIAQNLRYESETLKDELQEEKEKNASQTKKIEELEEYINSI